MKILYLTKYSRKGASSRLRSYQYFPFLEHEGFDITVKPLFDDSYLENLYKGKKSIFHIIKAYSKRFFILFTVKNYDNIFIEKELFPYLPSFFEGCLNWFEIKYIVDYDDAIFHNYDISKNKIIRFFLSEKINHVMRLSSHVIAGNSYLANKAKTSGAINVIIIPTVIDLKRYEVLNNKLKEKFIIGWIGSPSTFKYLISIAPVLKQMANLGAQIHIIGAKGDLGFTKNIRFIEWKEESETSEIALFNVGIMPLEDSLWEKGKCSYKLIQYMASKIPVIASNVGMNKEVVKNNFNGFLVETQKQWEEALMFYYNNVIEQKIHGENGYESVVKDFTVQSQLEKLIYVFEKGK